MVNGVSLGQALQLTIAVIGIMKLGLQFSAFGLLSFALIQRARRFLGYEPREPNQFKLLFEQFFSIILDPLGAKVGAIDRPPYVTTILFQVSLGVVVLVGALTFQISSMFAVTGVAFAGYHLFGHTFDLVSAYHGIVAVSIFLAIVFTTYGNQRIEEMAQYA